MVGSVGGILVAVTADQTLETLERVLPRMVMPVRVAVQVPIQSLGEWLDPLRSANPYGLFRVMTRERPEITVEGSDDGVIWKAYRFRWKPGELDRRPRFATPHMPRLDWQMWFAALAGDCRATRGSFGSKNDSSRVLPRFLPCSGRIRSPTGHLDIFAHD